ncbi:gamma-glutamyltranspeptidase/glutathione hydrolase [Rhizomicrobium palustre]|uniref:Gamma-glutamyltranspeptidase/glutathione hydrolase n=1 Tax=Rhizomicrobium palustre TaxID=189966 RepID=A0A846N1P8_9PROT|nr:gamma-glutamyltransferase [Rhizomicrobium palustre]NIK89395.1 gamma-glutamyltranspeptidase/glutathione hydrolase [Rhizomicrobium palustre]
MIYARALAGVAGLVLLAGCSVDLGSVGDTVGLGSKAQPQGLAVGDEPFAVRVGAATLAQGGSAADAASAMYFALSVTYPVAAGLGGGGICIVHDPAKNETVEYDFQPRDAASGGAYAVPGAVRGMALMQGQYGNLPWQKVVSPAEGYARAGFPVSKALADRLASTVDVIRLDAGLSAAFLDESGKPIPVGTMVTNPDLANTLAAIREAGPDGFYAGAVGQKISAYAASEGGAITAADLASAKAQVTTPRVSQMGSQYIYLPSQKTGAGAFAGAVVDHLARATQTDIGGKDLQASVVYATQQALKDYKVSDLPKDLGATGFAAMDNKGQAVACAVTMNGPFGSGHTARGTGVTLAKAPSSGAAGLASAFLTPVIAAPRTDEPAVLAGAGAGGPNGTAAIAYALARITAGDEILTRKDLRTTGVAPYDTVNALVCSGSTCVALPDPAASGLGAAVPTRKK